MLLFDTLIVSEFARVSIVITYYFLFFFRVVNLAGPCYNVRMETLPLSCQIVDRLRERLVKWGAGRAVSAATGISEPTISRIAGRKRTPTTRQVDLLDAYLGVRLAKSVGRARNRPETDQEPARNRPGTGDGG